MGARALLAASASLLQLLLAASQPVDQSTCRVIWMLKVPCTEPAAALVNQVKMCSSKESCDGQEECMYEMLDMSPNWLEIKHTSPGTHKITIIRFELFPPAAPHFCKIRSISTTESNNATSPNDYCLLYNLIAGSGLTEAAGYRQLTSDQICPAMKSATCT